MPQPDKKERSRMATVLGLISSLYTALVVVDLDNMNYNLPSTWLKLIGIVLPAIGGSISEIKTTK